MALPDTASARGIAATVLVVAALAGAAWWRIGGEWNQAPATSTPGTPQQAADAPAPAADAAAAAIHVEVSPPSEEGPLLPFLHPGSSFGHQAGLNKIKDDLHLSASAALVVDQGTQQVLLQRNEDAVLPMASLTKLMTAVVVTEAKLPMNEVITVTEDDVDGERHSRSRLRVGTSLTRSEALHIALMASENRAAHALGRTFPGGLDAFVKAMNRKAAALGMKSTTYVDPTGLSNRNQSTARDLAALVAVATRNPLLTGFSTDPQHLLAVGRGHSIQYRNSNRLVKNPRWEIDLQKTGYIVEAGWCMVLDAKIAGRNLLMILLDAGSGGNRISDAERIKKIVTAKRKVASNDNIAAGPAGPRS